MTEHHCAAESAEIREEAYQYALQSGKDRNLRLTGLRKRILKMIIYTSEPLSAYALVSLCGETGPALTATTVYRTLDFLEEHGLVHRLASRNAYISCIKPGHSLHGQFFICQNCHGVSELHIESVSKAIETCAKSRNFLVQREIVEVWGLCQECQT